MLGRLQPCQCQSLSGQPHCAGVGTFSTVRTDAGIATWHWWRFTADTLMMQLIQSSQFQCRRPQCLLLKTWKGPYSVARDCHRLSLSLLTKTDLQTVAVQVNAASIGCAAAICSLLPCKKYCKKWNDDFASLFPPSPFQVKLRCIVRRSKWCINCNVALRTVPERDNTLKVVTWRKHQPWWQCCGFDGNVCFLCYLSLVYFG